MIAIKQPHATLFVTTYEMPRHLQLVFSALLSQSFSDFEVVVCDDGSGEETKKIIAQFSEEFFKKTDHSVKHAWQEHQGFRKCKVLNEGLRVAHTSSTYIFLDGDCVPHRDFILDHVKNQEKGHYLAGRRVELGPKFSKKLTPAQVMAGIFNFPGPAFIKSVIAKDSEHFQRSLRVSARWLRTLLGMTEIDDLKGCNYSVSRADLLAINGFDEEYEGYGREDTDVEMRLQHLGLKIKSLKGLALQFHVWHERRAFTPKNDDRLSVLRKTRRVRCEKGWIREIKGDLPQST